MSTPEPLALPNLIDMDLSELLLRGRLLLDGSFRDRPGDLVGLLPALLARCQSDVYQPEAVLELVRPIARAAPQPARQALLEALERGVVHELQPALVDLLTELGLDRHQLHEECLTRLAGPDAAERMRAMTLLCALGPATPAARQAVLEADLGRFWHLEEARAAALAAAGPVGVQELIAALSHPSQLVSARAEAALQRLGADAAPAVPALLLMPQRQESDEAPGWPSQPSPALFAIGAAAVPALLAALGSPSPQVRARALVVLDQRKHDDPAIVSALIAALDERDGMVYREAIQSLVWAGPSTDVAEVPAEVLPRYLDRLADACERLRVGVAVALAMGGPLDDERVTEVLTLALISPDEEVRWHAAWGVGALPSPPSGLVARICGDDHLVEPFADRVGRRCPTNEGVLDALASAFLRLPSHPEAIRDALVRAGTDGAAALLDRCLSLREPDGRATHLFVDMGLDAAVAVWRLLQENEEGELLPFTQAVVLYRLLCACGGADEAVEVLRGHPSGRVRALAAAGMAAAPTESAAGLIAALEDSDAEVRRQATLSALGHWLAEEADVDWRERFIEATLRVLVRVGLPAELDLAELGGKAGTKGAAAMLTALARVCDQASATECAVVCELIERAADSCPWRPREETDRLKRLLGRLTDREEPGVRSAARAAERAISRQPPGG